MQKILILFLTLLITAALAGCRSVKYVTMPIVTHDTLRITQRTHDSIITRDTFLLDRYRQGDTVYITRNVTRYLTRVSLRHDTIYKARRDTVSVPVEVVKYKTQTPTTMKLAIVVLAIILIILYVHHRNEE